ncbi:MULTISPECIES: RNA polymerase sigma-70 factor [Sphingobacterium]|uniref:RNA polymerase sigma-70 factor n=1 Tax=Sphingobacterium tenebrionis TaxID=3111775 RepID=A0ABU8I1Q1_9SPHI|nr:RNA polymerase sigma-70 factor [Sphingobacterium sp. CZ-2]QBR11023.1 RNA polymerase sigma-70 factor [Sphingobacterium sp. CZ-2]
MEPKGGEIDWVVEKSKIAIAKDATAFKLLFNHFYAPLLGFSLSITGNKEISEDIMADFMVKLWTQPEKLLKINHLKTYLYTSVKNLSLNALEKIKVRHNHLNSLNPEPRDLINPEREFLIKELKNQIEQAIAQLPPKSKMALILIRDNDCSYKEAADIMEVSIKTIDRHLQIAMGKIKENLNL